MNAKAPTNDLLARWRNGPQTEAAGPPLMLEVRLRGGERVALGYGYLIATEYEPTGLILTFQRHVVTVTGRNLDRVYRGVVNHALLEIAETDEAEQIEAGDRAEVVESVAVEER